MSKRNPALFKTLDYYLGIPLIFFLGLFRKKKKKPVSIERIGVLITAALGDTTLLTAMLQDLKEAYPKAHLTIFSGESNAPLLPHLPSVDERVILPIKSPLKAIGKLSSYPLDVLIDAGSWPRINSLLTLSSSALWTIGFKTPGQGRHFGYDSIVLHRKDLHEVDNYRRLLSPLNITRNHPPKLLLTTRYHMEKPFVIFHLFATSYKPELREWPFKYWQEILGASPYPVYLTGSRHDIEKNETFMAFCGYPENLYNLAGKTTLAESLSILSEAEYVISINTGVMHMAAALETPVIGLSGPAPIHRWGALGPHSINLAPDVEGVGCLNLGFDFPKKCVDTMPSLVPSKVLAALQTNSFQEKVLRRPLVKSCNP